MTRGATNFAELLVGLLDELQQQAQQRQANDEDAAKRKAEREEIYRTRLEPGMSALHEFLKKLIDNLKLLQPKKPARYMLGGYGEIVAYVEHDYELKIERQPGSLQLILRFPCVIAAAECPSVEVLGGNKVRAVSQAFQRHHLGGLLESRKNANGEVTSATFQARGKLTLSATFVADADNALVRMQFVNIDGLESVTKHVAADQFNDALFDEIGRYLMREPNMLFREDLPDDYRLQLRTQLQQDQIKRRWESTINDRQETELAQLRREHSLTARLSGMFARDTSAGSSTMAEKLKRLIGKDR